MRAGGFIVLLLLMSAIASDAAAAVTEFINKSAWQMAVGSHAAITFQGLPQSTLVFDQFASLGVIFPDGNDRVLHNANLINDGVGLRSSDFIYGTINLSFSVPMTGVAADFLGNIDIQLYLNGQLVFESITFRDSQSRFGGLISTIPFDAAVIRDPSDSVVVIDDLFFGPAVPAPGALGVLGVIALCSRRRRG